jgi:integrase
MLTTKQLDALKEPGRYPVGGCAGLLVQVTLAKDQTPRRSFVYRYKIAGRAREAGLGAYPTITLKTARERAREMASLKVRGIDPLEEKAKAQEAAIPSHTFRQAAEAFLKHTIAQKAAKKPNSKFGGATAKSWRSVFERFVYPRIGALDVREVKSPHVTAILEPLVIAREPNRRKGKGGPTVAFRVRSRIERVIEYAGTKGWRDSDTPNPARPKLYETVLGDAPETNHQRAAPLKKVPAIYQKIAAEPGTVFAALRFLVLTTTRMRETLDCRWEEIDLPAKLWRIPPSRSKTGVELVIPLSEAALRVIEGQATTRISETWVFAGRFNRPMSSSTIGSALARIGITSTVPHGFRSSWSDWCSEIGFRSTRVEGEGEKVIGPDATEIREFQLGHLVGNAATQAYRRGRSFDARRVALNRYADWLAGKPEPKAEEAAGEVALAEAAE